MATCIDAGLFGQPFGYIENTKKLKLNDFFYSNLSSWHSHLEGC